MPRVWGIVDFYLTVAQPGIAANTSKERHEPGALVLVYTHRHTHAQKHGQTKPSRQSQTPATRMPMTQLQELPVYTHTHTLSSKPRLGHPGSLSSSPPHLLRLRLRLWALHSREGPSAIQEAQVMPDPTVHLDHMPAVGNGLREVVGCLAARAHMETEHMWSDVCRNTHANARVSKKRDTFRNTDTGRTWRPARTQTLQRM